MAFIKITELPSGDSDLSRNDLLTTVDTQSGTNRKVSVGSLQDFMKVDSEHGWNKSEHSDLQDNIDSVYDWASSQFDSTWTAIGALDSDARADRGDRFDSEHAWNVAEHAGIDSDLVALKRTVDSDITADLNALRDEFDSDISVVYSSLDSEHSWNVSEQDKLQSNIDSNYTNLNLNINNLESKLDSELSVIDERFDSLTLLIGENNDDEIDQIKSDLDSEHARNIAKHSSLQSSIDAEELVRSYADSNLGVRIDVERAWNVTEHDALHGADSDLSARLDSETAARIAAGNIADASVTGVIATWNDVDGQWQPNSGLGIDASGNVTVTGGFSATKPDGGFGSLAVGKEAGNTSQDYYAVAVGQKAGRDNQGALTTAVGSAAGRTDQHINATAVGNEAGRDNQGASSTAVGVAAGQIDQGSYAVAVGNAAGKITQSTNAVAVGNSAGNNTQGANSIAIGKEAGHSGQGANGIIINSSGGVVNNTTAGHIIIKSSTQDLRSLPAGGFSANGLRLTDSGRQYLILKTLRTAVDGQTTFEGLRDALKDALTDMMADNLTPDIEIQSSPSTVSGVAQVESA